MNDEEIGLIIVSSILILFMIVYILFRRYRASSSINSLIKKYGLDSIFIDIKICEYLKRNIEIINDIIPKCRVIKFYNDMLYLSCISKLKEFNLNSEDIKYIIKNGDYNYIAIQNMILLYNYDKNNCNISVMKYYDKSEINNSQYVIGIYLDQVYNNTIITPPNNLSALSHKNG